MVWFLVVNLVAWGLKDGEGKLRIETSGGE
jgi:hypothetical protein